MTIRIGILERLQSDLSFLESLNGYELNLNNKIIKGYVSFADVKNYPTICFQFGNETREKINEGGTWYLCNLKLILAVHFKTSKEQGNLTDYSEQVISDLTKFINQDNSISGYGTSEHKVLNLQKVMTSVENNKIIGVKSWELKTIYPILDSKNGIGQIGFEIEVQYIDANNKTNVILS